MEQQPTATRRLVKSPPELWAELSSEDSLGRHLAEFGEIRITRVKPQTTVAWEGDRASGTVELTPTGWGTKVKLTATPAMAAPEEAPEPRAAPQAPPRQATPQARPRQATPQAARARVEVARPAPPTVAARVAPPGPPATAAEAAPEAQRGFFARFFRKRHPEAAAPPAPAAAIPGPPAPAPAAAIPGPPAPAPDPAPPAPSPSPAPIPPPAPDPVPPTPSPQPPAPPQIEVLDPDRTVAILTEVLDDLGAAHHRPFSRD